MRVIIGNRPPQTGLRSLRSVSRFESARGQLRWMNTTPHYAGLGRSFRPGILERKEHRMKNLITIAVLLCALLQSGCAQQKRSWVEREWDTFINVNIPRAKQQASDLFR